MVKDFYFFLCLLSLNLLTVSFFPVLAQCSKIDSNPIATPPARKGGCR